MSDTNTTTPKQETTETVTTKDVTKKRTKKRVESYGTFIYKVLKQVHPDAGLTKKSQSVLHSFCCDVFSRISKEAIELCEKECTKTISSRIIQTSVSLCIPGKLKKHARSEGTKACTKYETSMIETKGKTSHSARAGLLFPVGRLHRYLKNKWGGNVGVKAAVYLAAVMEYMVAEVLKLSGNAARDMKAVRLASRHIQFAIRGDEELDTFCKHVIIPGGGTIPHIHRPLLKKTKKSKKVKTME